MRAKCILAVRSPRDAEAMASVLQVIGAIERIGNDAVDIARIVTHRLGIPRELVADLSNAEEVVAPRAGPRRLAHGAPPAAARSSCRSPPACGSWPSAASASGSPTSRATSSCCPATCSSSKGPPAGIARLRELANAPYWEPPVPPEDGTLSDLDRAIDVLVEMKNISEVAVGLAYSALVLRDAGLAAEVRHLEDRLDEMKDRLELWVLRAGAENIDPSPLRGLLHLAQAAEDIGDAAQQMVWLIEQNEEIHPILSIALGETDEVVVRVPVAAGSRADGATLARAAAQHRARLRRARRASWRPLLLPAPRASVVLLPGDELIASGPDEGRELLAELLGWVFSSIPRPAATTCRRATVVPRAREWDPNRLGDPVA